ncbi:MAG: hypothetical protein M1828_005596 [Chrysothrix sp. TS-e1954]|nr:MAG: hypothetical protein M1828_005596 [Chrysothrix sp. TS-e1954]
MGYDYALVHIKYTIPPCILLTLLYRPVFSLTDAYKVSFLITVAVVSTIPWDSYLIRSNIWSYPQDAVLGHVLFDIPVEELFFFVIQTYGVSLLYLCISKPTLTPLCLPHKTTKHVARLSNSHGRTLGIALQVLMLCALVWGAHLVREGSRGSYLGLIISWALPFILFLWSLTYDFLMKLPLATVCIPVLLPTYYLWLVDTWAMNRGTWVIVTDTKLGINIWDGLEVEEAIFFLVTNCMVVLGLVAFDKAMAILQTFPDFFPETSLTPSPYLAMKALLLPREKYDDDRLLALSKAAEKLKAKSRSFYLASSAFSGQLRIDLIHLYAYCRIADDLVDSASTVEEAKKSIAMLRGFLDLAYATPSLTAKSDLRDYIHSTFTADAHLILEYLPTSRLSKLPLYDLLKGFEMDLDFYELDQVPQVPKTARWPIKTQTDLELYGKYVAGTVAELCLDLVFFHHPRSPSSRPRATFQKAGALMGTALQVVNIARDVQVDAAIFRVYLPSDWLKDAGTSHEEVLRDPRSPVVAHLRTRLLDIAFAYYNEASSALEDLPVAARGPMRMAVENYMEIGRMLRIEGYQIRPGKATVPALRRLWVGWRALNQ